VPRALKRARAVGVTDVDQATGEVDEPGVLENLIDATQKPL
jgi:hypothetical protein